MIKLKRELEDNNKFPGLTEIDEYAKQTKNNYEAKYPCKANKSCSLVRINTSESWKIELFNIDFWAKKPMYTIIKVIVRFNNKYSTINQQNNLYSNA